MSSNKQAARPTNGTAWRGTAHSVEQHAPYNDEDRAQLAQFEARLNRCLTDLGRLDYNLQSAINGLLSGLETDDGKTLRGQLAEIAEPALQAKMLDLAETVREARYLARLSMKKLKRNDFTSQRDTGHGCAR